MAMFLKLEASDKVSTAIQSTPGIPDFMDWNQLTALPAFWVPFKSLRFTLLAVPLVPGAAGADHRPGHVQAAGGRRLLRHHHPGHRRHPLHPASSASRATPAGSTASPTSRPCRAGTSAPTRPAWSSTTSTPCCCWAPSGSAPACCTSKLGRLLVAMRDKEERVRFSGLRRRQPQDLRLRLRAPCCRPSAARCSPCRWASCRPRSSASCPRSRW